MVYQKNGKYAAQGAPSGTAAASTVYVDRVEWKPRAARRPGAGQRARQGRGRRLWRPAFESYGSSRRRRVMIVNKDPLGFQYMGR